MPVKQDDYYDFAIAYRIGPWETYSDLREKFSAQGHDVDALVEKADTFLEQADIFRQALRKDDAESKKKATESFRQSAVDLGISGEFIDDIIARQESILGQTSGLDSAKRR